MLMAVFFSLSVLNYKLRHKSRKRLNQKAQLSCLFSNTICLLQNCNCIKTADLLRKKHVVLPLLEFFLLILGNYSVLSVQRRRFLTGEKELASRSGYKNILFARLNGERKCSSRGTLGTKLTAWSVNILSWSTTRIGSQNQIDGGLASPCLMIQLYSHTATAWKI